MVEKLGSTNVNRVTHCLETQSGYKAQIHWLYPGWSKPKRSITCEIDYRVTQMSGIFGTCEVHTHIQHCAFIVLLCFIQWLEFTILGKSFDKHPTKFQILPFRYKNLWHLMQKYILRLSFESRYTFAYVSGI